MDFVQFCKKLPKIELHAHINGSISPQTMKELVKRKKATKPELADFSIPEGLEYITDFFPLFKFIYQLTDDEESVRLVTRRTIDEFAEDGVRYLELRSTPRANPETGMTKESYVASVLSVVNEPRQNIRVKLIISIDRRNTLEEAQEVVDLAIKFRDQGIVGIDLCGDVMVGSFDKLKPAFERAKAEHFKITLHFNEVKENIPEAPSMLSVNPDRLGHATLLDDASRETIYKNQCPIEVCMTSNVLCKTVSSYEAHHVKDLLKQGHPFVLCTDDKGVFFSELSNEYAKAGVAFDMTREQLFQASFQAIDAIFDDDRVKETLKQDWQTWRKLNQQEFSG
ncbi:uncharacterized protein BYT42DRAFT_551783 [Radiomyces spectabilis]|uniref:uncharacterized protein n=1 Tax=Radiomyces spectabilis TaxID=64574 RepID=UPI00221FCAF0|nr:uncharacterized protein BYT42DRAFT_551783 [Radiomyces spectabilis]KAI8393651.1 hypothetical protein BYT42DRAFT_551783 [Radiomyces spectabilis]